MKRVVLWSVVAALAGAAGGAVALVFLPVELDVVLDLYLLLLGGVVLLGLVQLTRTAHRRQESQFERALRRRAPPPERPEPLVRLERQVVLAGAAAFDVHYRLRPVLQEIARDRLWRRRGVELDSEQPAARAALGEAVWGLVQPHRTPPADTFAPGMGVSELREVVETLERL